MKCLEVSWKALRWLRELGRECGLALLAGGIAAVLWMLLT
jgi:hypothetical protein